MILDAKSAEAKRLHIDILNDYFGCSYRGHMKADWRPQGVNDWMVWFPKMLKNKDGSPKPSSDGWCNIITESDTLIREYNVNPKEVNEHSAEVYNSNPYRVTFAYNEVDKNYYFKGVFITDVARSTADDHYFKRVATRLELSGQPVRTIKILKDVVEALDDSHTMEEMERHALSLPEDSLREVAATRKNHNTVCSQSVVTRYRDPYISLYAKKRANGVCQLCGERAPFEDKNGQPYLESHHIKWLSRGGEDAIENVVGLCPNCHRKMHVLDLQQDIEKLLQLVE